VVTASHNPATDNGLKLWTPSGKAFGPDQRAATERRIREDDYGLAAWDGVGDRTRRDGVRDHHADAIESAVDLERSPSVVVDIGNGTGGVTASVLDDLGCRVRTLNGQEDGSFPGRPSEPTAETLETLSTLVAETDAELGWLTTATPIEWWPSTRRGPSSRRTRYWPCSLERRRDRAIGLRPRRHESGRRRRADRRRRVVDADAGRGRVRRGADDGGRCRLRRRTERCVDLARGDAVSGRPARGV